MKILARIIDGFAILVIGSVALLGMGAAGFGVFYVVRGICRYLLSREGEGLFYGLILSLTFTAAVRWIIWRGKRW